MKTPSEIYLDLDDVLNTFTESFLDNFGLKPDITTLCPKIGWDMTAQINRLHGLEDDDRLTAKALWSMVRPSFWSAVPKAEHTDELVAMCFDLVGPNNVFVATSPTKCSQSMAEKHKWIIENLPEQLHRQFFVTPRKWKLSQPGSLLIDDCWSNIWSQDGPRWEARGGDYILVPRPWNTLHEQTSQAFAHIKAELEARLEPRN